jgi:hypothetical protein
MIIVIGRIPPPIGGVTIYVDRLIDNLSISNMKFRYVVLNIKNLFFIHRTLDGEIIHLIASNPLLRLYYSLICKVYKKKLIITYTDNINSFSNSFSNSLNRLSIKLSFVPLVSNIDSFNIARIINTNSRLISLFIPPKIDDNNLYQLRMHLGKFLSENKFIFCTNASRFDKDKSGNEIYGIISLISIFNSIPKSGLIISDPSETYSEYIRNNNIVLNPNIKLLCSNTFQFIDIIKLSDCVIRATTTDGDSLSIREALYLNKDVICSDCVSRPDRCMLYPTNDLHYLYKLIANYNYSNVVVDGELSLHSDGFIEILHIYNELINS